MSDLSNYIDHEAYGVVPQEALERARAGLSLLCEQIRDVARAFAPPEPGEPGYEVEGRVIASELFALADMWDPPEEATGQNSRSES